MMSYIVKHLDFFYNHGINDYTHYDEYIRSFTWAVSGEAADSSSLCITHSSFLL